MQMNLPEFCREQESGITLFIRLTPKAAQDRFRGVSADNEGRACLNIQIRAAPEDGKANKALLKFLSKQLKLPLSQITLAKGHTARFKQLILQGDKQELCEKLRILCKQE